MRDERKTEQTNQLSGNSLESRVRELERKVIRMRRVCFVGLTIAMVATISGQAATESEVLKAKVIKASEIHVVDDDGMVRILLRVDDDNRSQVLLKCSENGLKFLKKPNAQLVAHENGSSLMLSHPTGHTFAMAWETMKGITAKTRGLKANARLTVDHTNDANLFLSGSRQKSKLHASTRFVKLTDDAGNRKSLNLHEE